jgi:hypothetical protein
MGRSPLRKQQSKEDYAGYLASTFMRPNAGFQTLDVNPFTTTGNSVSVVCLTQATGIIEASGGGLYGYIPALGSYLTAAGNDPSQSHQAVIEEPDYDPQMVAVVKRLDAEPPAATFNNIEDLMDWLERP